MESKRQRLFKEVPFDCWCEIIKFFHLPTDLLSLLLVVKGFYEYLNNHSTNSAKNIEFCLSRIPSRSKSLVSQLNYFNSEPEYVGETILKKFGSSSLEIVFRRIFMRFPNLLSFNFSISGYYYKETRQRVLRGKSSCKSCGIFSSVKLTNIFSPCQILKKLNLTFYETELHINHLFPKLEFLVLFRFGKVKRPVLGNESLFINWKKLPSLRTCHLSGWVVKSFSSENINILRQLDELKLDSTDSNEICLDRDEEEVVKDLGSIKNLIIEYLSLRHFRKITNLSTESLSLGNGEYSEYHRALTDDFLLRSVFSIMDMLFLTTIRIDLSKGDTEYWDPLNSPMTIKNLPVLRTVCFKHLLFCVSLKEVPSLLHIELDGCPYSIIFDDIYDAPLAEDFLLDYASFSPKLLEWVNVHKDLKRIALVEDGGYDGEISFSDFSELESIDIDFSVKMFSNCPKLKNVKFYETSDDYTGFTTPVDHLESLVVESLKGNTFLSETFFGRFLENVKMIDFVELDCGENEKYNVYLESRNVRNIRKLDISSVNEFVISGDCSDEAILDLKVKRCSKVEVTGLLSLKKVFISNVSSEVIIRKCKNLESVSIFNTGGKKTKKKEKNEGLKIILEDLIELKTLRIVKTQIREMVTRNIGNSNLTRKYSKDEFENVSLLIE